MAERRGLGCGFTVFCLGGIGLSITMTLYASGVFGQVEARPNNAVAASAPDNRESQSAEDRASDCGGYCQPGDFNQNQDKQEGLAHYYAYEAKSGKGRTASGAIWNPNNKTAASWFYPFGTRLRVCNVKPQPEHDTCVDVEVNDRGPNRGNEGRPDVVIDLSRGAFEKIASLSTGEISVSVRKLP